MIAFAVCLECGARADSVEAFAATGHEWGKPCPQVELKAGTWGAEPPGRVPAFNRTGGFRRSPRPRRGARRVLPPARPTGPTP